MQASRFLKGHRLWIARLTLLCLGTVLSIAFVEIGLRVAGVHVPTATVLGTFFQYDREAGWRGRAVASGRFKTAWFDTQVSHDVDGFRVSLPQSLDTGSRSALPVVWCLGDSGTWGWGVSDGETYIDELNRLENGSRQFRNMGIPGYSSVQQYLLLKSLFASACRPQQVLILFCVNDLTDNIAGDDDPPRPCLQHHAGLWALENYPAPRSSRAEFGMWIKRHSRTCQVFDFGWHRMLQARRQRRNLFAVSHRATAVTAPESPLANEERTGALREIYSRIRDLCAEQGVSLAIVGPFDAPPELKTVCQELDLQLIDLRQYLREHSAHETTPQPLYFAGDPHCNAAGHLLIAEGIHSQLPILR